MKVLKSMKSSHFGYDAETLGAAVQLLMLSGQMTVPQKLFEVAVPKKSAMLLKKSLQISELWDFKDDITYNTYGMAFQGTASWGVGLTVRMAAKDYRFKVLHLDRFGKRMVYLLPVAQLSTLSALPQIDLSHDEMKMLLQMADDISNNVGYQEYFMKIKHPVKKSILQHTADWRHLPYNRCSLLELLSKEPLLLEVVVTALDAQLRSLKKMSHAPQGITNFILPGKDDHAEKWLYSALQALTFSNEQGIIYAGPVEIRAKGVTALQQWEACYNRLAVLRASTSTLLSSLLEQAQESERTRKCGGLALQGFPTAPIILSKAPYCCSSVTDVKLPEDVQPLNCMEQDLLRTAMSQTLSKSTAKRLYHCWLKQVSSMTAYRLLGLKCWRDILRMAVIEMWFPDDDLYTQATQLMEATTATLEEDALKREAELARACDFIAQQKLYEDLIVNRPKSIQDWDDKCKKGAVAFHYIPAQGDDKGKRLLAFTPVSLRKLLNTIGLSESLFQAFLTKCEINGLLKYRKHNIKFGKDQVSAIVFSLETI